MIPKNAKEQVIDYARDRESPIMVGEVALMLGPLCTISEALSVLAELESEGLVRPLTKAEQKKFDRRMGYIWCKKKV